MNHWCCSVQSLQAQKSDNLQMKAKLRRLEEENTKREKQIEQLLDPTKVRSLSCFTFSSWTDTLIIVVVFFNRDLNILVVWWIRKATGAW